MEGMFKYQAIKDVWNDVQGAIDRLILSILEGILCLFGVVVLVLILPRCFADLQEGIRGCAMWIREHPAEVSQWLALGRIFFFLYGLTSFLGALADIWNECPHCYGLTLSEEDIDKNIRIRDGDGETYLQGFDTWKSGEVCK